MDIILSYLPSCNYEIVKDGVIKLREDCWISTLAKKIYPHRDNIIKYIGRDDKKRIEISMNILLFERIKHEPLFVLHAEGLRRARLESHGMMDLMEYITQPRVIVPFDNDLDDIEQ